MANNQTPEWADGRKITAQFGLTATPLYRLRKAGTIRSVSLRGEGDKYGKRLYHVGSIREYIAKQEQKEAAR